MSDATTTTAPSTDDRAEVVALRDEVATLRADLETMRGNLIEALRALLQLTRNVSTTWEHLQNIAAASTVGSHPKGD